MKTTLKHKDVSYSENPKIPGMPKGIHTVDLIILVQTKTLKHKKTSYPDNPGSDNQPKNYAGMPITMSLLQNVRGGK
ncbi:MAG: hypothetical protein OXD54_04860 [Candidatus Poribacteria bacterium]|nr:hypothetical protein [Candidatus Poribacteria bacterium]